MQKLLREGTIKDASPQPVPESAPPAPKAATASGGLDADRRKALEGVLGELETLRDLLKSDA